MKELKAKFLLGSPSRKFFPDTKLPEFAFAGRSNVGKSSMINFLTWQNKLAKTSSTPGKTKEINFFDIDNQWILADLPGYGYAKTGKKERERIQLLIRDYLHHRNQIFCVFVLIDSRIPPQSSDLEFLKALGEKNLPCAIIFTKADKPGSKGALKYLKEFEKRMLEDWEELPPSFITSSSNKIGREQILDFIDSSLISTN